MVSYLPSPTEYMARQLLAARKHSRMTQQELGEQLGVTRQQIDKYEKGTNAITFDRLPKLCEILSVPRDYFFQDGGSSASDSALAMPPATPYGAPDVSLEETLKAAYPQLTQAERTAIIALAHELADKKKQPRKSRKAG